MLLKPYYMRGKMNKNKGEIAWTWKSRPDVRLLRMKGLREGSNFL